MPGAQTLGGQRPPGPCFGGNGGGVTPVTISNTEVKPSSADGTAWETLRESRTLPDYLPAMSGLFLSERVRVRTRAGVRGWGLGMRDLRFVDRRS